MHQTTSHRKILLGRVIAVTLALSFGLPGTATAGPDPEVLKLLMEAQKHLTEQHPDLAVEAMKKVVKLDPKNDGHLATLSDLERQTGKYADGIEHALQAIKINDKVPTYYLLVAINAYNDQDLDLAREYCDKVLKGSSTQVSPSVLKDAQAIADMLTKQTYTLTWNLDPQKGLQTKGTVLGSALVVAVPKADLPYQTATYEVSGAQNYKLVKSDANDLMVIVPKGKQTIQLVTKITVMPYTFKKLMDKPSAGPVPLEARPFLGASESIDPKSPKLLKVVSGLKGTNDTETARNILEWMRKNIHYRLQKKGIGELDFKTMDEIVERGYAECRGYTLLFTALCRAAGLPARSVWGLAKLPATESKPKGDFASHNWCEVYVNGCGWVPVDPQKPESFGLQPTAHLRFFMDEKKKKEVFEILPILNLVYMNGESIKFE